MSWMCISCSSPNDCVTFFQICCLFVCFFVAIFLLIWLHPESLPHSLVHGSLYCIADSSWIHLHHCSEDEFTVNTEYNVVKTGCDCRDRFLFLNPSLNPTFKAPIDSFVSPAPPRWPISISGKVWDVGGKSRCLESASLFLGLSRLLIEACCHIPTSQIDAPKVQRVRSCCNNLKSSFIRGGRQVIVVCYCWKLLGPEEKRLFFFFLLFFHQGWDLGCATLEENLGSQTQCHAATVTNK